MKTQALRKSGKKQVDVKTASLKSEKTDILFNEAFDLLNSSAIHVQSLSSETSDVLNETLKCGVQLYKTACLQREARSKREATRFIQTTIGLARLILSLAEEEIKNVLSLPQPPPLKKDTVRHAIKKGQVHDSLILIDSYLSRKINKGSRFYCGRIMNYPKILGDVSKCLKKLETYH